MCTLLVVGACASRSSAKDAGPDADKAFTAQRSADDMHLKIFFGGGPPLVPGNPCTFDYQVESAETSKTVALRIVSITTPATSSTDGPIGCPAVGYGRVLEVSLQAPLNGRQVVEARTGAVQRVIGPDEYPGPTTTGVPGTPAPTAAATTGP